MGARKLATFLTCGCYDQNVSRRQLVAGLASSGGSLALAATEAVGQELWTGGLSSSCSFYENERVDNQIWTFKSSKEATDVITRITDSVGLPANFKVAAANVPNAAAIIKSAERFILYSETFIQQIIQSTASEWSAWTILAHEVGHHLSGHTLTSEGSGPPLELQADRFAGFAVGRMGATLKQAQASYQGMSEQGSTTHPPRGARLQAVATGWQQATSSATPPPPPPPPPSTATQNPVQVLAWIIQGIANNNLRMDRLTPQVLGMYQQQRLLMAQNMQMSGQIMNITQMNSAPGTLGDTVFYFNVQF